MGSIFQAGITLQQIQQYNHATIGHHLGIEYLTITDNSLTARMPVDARTRQPFGLLHGGASVVLAEDLGSLASWLTLDPAEGKATVGLEINANHIRGVREGWVYGKVTPIHLGKKTHVWDIRITDADENLVCVCRLTTMIIDIKK